MVKLRLAAVIWIAVLLVAFVAAGTFPGLLADAQRGQHLTSMGRSAAAVVQAAESMKVHGQVMVDEARRTGDQNLLAQGEHWIASGEALLAGEVAFGHPAEGESFHLADNSLPATAVTQITGTSVETPVLVALLALLLTVVLLVIMALRREIGAPLTARQALSECKPDLALGRR